MTDFLSEYLAIILFLGISLGLGIVLLALPFVVAPVKPDAEKLSAYECGFNAFDDARMKFDVRFYLISILFIVFDLETALLFPWALSFKHIGDVGFWAMIIFIVELALGLVYVWRKGALEWD